MGRYISERLTDGGREMGNYTHAGRYRPRGPVSSRRYDSLETETFLFRKCSELALFSLSKYDSS